MSEVEFTPGPWRRRFKNIGHVTAENGAVIAKCERLTSLCNVQANAYLISAAPDMYAALEGMIGQAIACFAEHYGENPEGGSLPEHIQKAQAALAKARGEA